MAKVKLMMSWDIQPGKEEEYFEFHVREFVPTLEKMGLALNEAWLTVYGEHQPRLMAEALIPSLAAARKVLASDSWRALDGQLDALVENFSYKVIPARTRWQM
jgi:hypothetical protein